MANIRVDLATTIIDGQSVTFRSPINCSQITGLVVYYPEDGVQTSRVFQFADAHGNNIGEKDLFAENVLVKVILDMTLNQAYVQNADTNAYLEAQLASKRPNTWLPTIAEIGAAPASIKIAKMISTPGWYKIGTLTPGMTYSGVATFYIGGQYYYSPPPGAVVDVVFAYNSVTAKTRIQSGDLINQVAKVGVVAESVSSYGVYVYYGSNSANIVEIHIDTFGATFTPEDFNVGGVDETGMMSVAYLWEYFNPPMAVGVEYRTTERWNGKPVYKQLIYGGGLPAAGSVNIPIPSSGTIDYIISAKGSVTAQRVFPSGKVASGMSIDLETHSGGIDVYTSHDWLGGAPFYVTVEYTLV